MVAIEPVEDVSQFVGAAADLREQQLAFLRVMEALGERMEIVGDQGDGMQVLARRRGRQPLGQDAERIRHAQHVAMFGLDDGERAHGGLRLRVFRAEIGGDHFGVAANLVGRPFGELLAVIEHDDVLRRRSSPASCRVRPARRSRRAGRVRR